MLAVEAIAKYTANGHIARPTILLAVTMLVVGLAHGRIAAWGDRRRELRIDEAGIGVPGRFFRRHTLAWAEIASFDLTETAAVITTVNGKTQRIDIADVMQPAAVRDGARPRPDPRTSARSAAAAPSARQLIHIPRWRAMSSFVRRRNFAALL